ncbi:helix-turn-helix transcriptional regulator [Lacticaseibacillus absianus]|uniref:helix-turn-helix transcriptional regulator n=1 Tax=Lacticaseibacillus absianus TaxID=2729623 RepID=UPI0015C775A0|nr:AraC family transcriptional regulator [Lacticaseibacillus absianus]
MSSYIEIPEWPGSLPGRCLAGNGFAPVAPHRHKEIEIIQARQGQTKLGCLGQTYTVSAGEIFIIPSGVPHYCLTTPNSLRNVFQFNLSIYDATLLHLTNAQLATLFQSCALHSRQWPPAVTDKLNRCLFALFEAETQHHSPAQMLSQLYTLLDLVEREVPHRHTPAIASAVKHNAHANATIQQLIPIYDYIESHYFEPISLQDVADLAGFNAQYFTRFFKRNTGTTFKQFLNEYRLMKASYLLVENDQSMAEIATRCGFQSVKTFQHEFKQKMGTSPLKYRKALLAH